jgi:DNA-binding transcriptional MerR regulator
LANLITPKQASKELGVSISSLRRYEEAGQLQSVRTPGNQRRYDQADIQALLTQPISKAAAPANFTNAKSRDVYSELGTNGLSRWGGTVYTESQRELRGASGRALYREMRLQDSVVSAMFFALIHSLRKAQERIVPASEKPADKEAAEFVESCLSDMSFTWADTMTFILDPTFEQGVSLLELVYKKRLGERPAKYIDNPSTSQFNDGKIGWRKWSPRPVESLSPGDEWIFDENGGLQGINQVDANTQRTYSIPIEKLLHFRTSVYPANTPEPPPIHRAAYLPYWYTTNLQEIEGIGIERNLNGMPVLYLGADCTKDAGTDSDLTKGKNLVTNIRNDEQMGVVLPKAKMGAGATEGNGMLLELLSAGTQTLDIGPVIERYDKRKAIIILAQFIMLGMDQVGSYALSRSQNDMFILAATSWLNSFADIINRHAIPRLMKLNAFPGITGMPTLAFSPLGIPDLAGISDYVNKLVDKAVLTPDEELERHLRQMADLPQKTEEEEGAAGTVLPSTNGTPVTGEGAPENLASIKGLNGAQINAALDILAQVSAGSITPTVGTELLMALGLDQARAEIIIRDTVSNPVPAQSSSGFGPGG